MKKIHQILTVACLLLCSNITGWADTITVTLTEGSDEMRPEDPGKGHRIPSRPLVCSIDSGTGTISFSKDIADVVSYEIWDETATVCLASYDDEASFCEQLFAIPGDYQIRIVTEDCVYIGYVSTI